MKAPKQAPLMLLFIISCLLACTGGREEADNFSSSRSLYVDYIASHTSGIISRKSNIKVKLAKKAENVKPGDKVGADIFRFEPSLAGTAYWEDAFTIVFEPQKPLADDTPYKARFHLKRILDTPREKEEFRFTFRVMKQNFEVSLGGMELYDSQNLNKVKLRGSLETADYASNSAIEKVVSARQNGQPLDIRWQHGPALHQHRFTLEQVERKEQEELVEIFWNGTAIDLKQEGSQAVIIPSLDDYKVMSAQVVKGAESYISVRFSDPLMEKQDLQGLVQLEGTDKAPRLLINLNELKIYPTSDMPEELSLSLYKSIKNVAGKELKQDFETKLQFSQQKPEVRLSQAEKGVILPGSDGLILPFEAVGLKEVDVTIVRIFEGNVLQYLQVNKLGESSQMQRVARPVARKVLPLQASGVVDLQKWNRYTLDLSDILQTEAGAIYQVILSFRKSQSIYFCAQNQEVEELPMEEEWGEMEEASNWDGYEENQYDYQWWERDNPCSPSYYRNRSVSKVLFSSDLGIIAKKSDQGNLHVFVSNLLNTKPQQEVKLEVYDYQQQLIASGTTDKEGKAEIKLSGKAFVLVARQGKQFGYLKLSDGNALSLSSFDVGGQSIQKGIKGFIYGERGVWRPGDTLHLSFMLEDKQHLLPENHPVIMELWNPQGQMAARQVKNNSLEGIYSFPVATQSDVPTGSWQVKVKVGGAEFKKNLKIETIKPNRLKIKLDFGRERLTALDKEISGDLTIRWLHGAKGQNLQAQFEVQLVPTKTSFEGFPNYSFDDASREFFVQSQEVFDGRVDAEGYARVNLKLNAENKAPGALRAVFKGKAFEEGGDFSIDQFSIPYYPYTSFVGLKAPEGDKRGLLLTDEDHTIQIATVDALGNPISRSQVKVELYKLEWKWWWDNSYEDLSNYVGRSYQRPVQEATIDTHNGKGSWKLRINHPEWGRYYVKVSNPVSGHSAGQIVAVDWPGWAQGTKEELDGASMLHFSADKQEYELGEKIKLSIPSSTGGRALVSLETGSQVLKTFWVETTAKSTQLEFEATANMTPNVYVHISMIQPHVHTLNDLPIRLYGLQSIKVVDRQTILQPQLSLDKELRPEMPFTVKVQEKEGKPMAYTLAVVEEGLLDISRFQTPDPWQVFYAREALGVKTWDLYEEVMGAYGGSIERLLAIGGDLEMKNQEQDGKQANRFKPVVKYLGPFYLEAGKTASHTLNMPQYIGSVRTMVVAAKDGAYGFAEATTPVKQPLMVLATLPRVAGPGEEIVLPVNVFAMQEDIKQVKVEIKTSGNLKLQGTAHKTVSFKNAGDQLTYFSLKAAEALGTAKVEVTATSGKFTATYDVELNIRAANPAFLKVEDKLFAGSEKGSLSYQPLGITGTNEGVLEISSLPPLNLEQRLQYLIRYPHGCVEQTTSAVFAQLYLDKLTTVSAERKEQIERNIKEAISRLKTFQLPSGGLAYWPGNEEVSAWGTSYAGHFLLEAKNKGYHVPEGLLSAWQNYQQQQAEQWAPGTTEGQGELVQAYRLYTLALSAQPALGAMNRMKERTEDQNARWRLALAYATAGHSSEAEKLVEGLTMEVKNYKALSGTYGSQERDQAMILETLLRLGKKEAAFGLLKTLAAKMSNADQWMSTQTTAYTLLAIAQYAEQNQLDSELNVKVKVNNRELTVNTKSFISQVFLQTPDQVQQMEIQNMGSAPVYTRLIRRGVPLSGKETAEARNIGLNVVYKSMNGEVINVDQLAQGTDFMASVVVHNTGTGRLYQELALQQLFPSGWEIINTRLNDSPQFYQQGTPEYQDIRDDRVYTYFDLKPNERKEYNVLLNASYRGKYYLPAVAVEAMYDNSIYANTAGKWVEVIPED